MRDKFMWVDKFPPLHVTVRLTHPTGGLYAKAAHDGLLFERAHTENAGPLGGYVRKQDILDAYDAPDGQVAFHDMTGNVTEKELLPLLAATAPHAIRDRVRVIGRCAGNKSNA
jgi:hypothetical protein